MAKVIHVYMHGRKRTSRDTSIKEQQQIAGTRGADSANSATIEALKKIIDYNQGIISGKKTGFSEADRLRAAADITSLKDRIRRLEASRGADASPKPGSYGYRANPEGGNEWEHDFKVGQWVRENRQGAPRVRITGISGNSLSISNEGGGSLGTLHVTKALHA